MAYSELIKSFSRIRTYMRSFYVYGFRHRSEYDEKSARGYDNERRRLESWLGDYMSFGQDAEGKRVFLSVDSRAVGQNPLYRAFKAKSFTDRDIMLHFHLLDILPEEEGLSLTEIMEELSDRLNTFDSDGIPDESTVRKKLGEYEKLGLLCRAKRGRVTVYSRGAAGPDPESWRSALGYFSEAAPLGVVGSFLLDRFPETERIFRFKHHYILNALDSEIVYELLCAIGEKRTVTLTKGRQRMDVLPLKLYVSVQTGRQYLLALNPKNDRFSFYRTDALGAVKTGERVSDGGDPCGRLESFQARVWGVAPGDSRTTEHLEMTVYAGKSAGHIVERLEREKRCGTVERLDECHWRFSAEVYDALEMLPWIRTFTGRITDFRCSRPAVTERFYADLEAVAALYGGEDDAVS